MSVNAETRFLGLESQPSFMVVDPILNTKKTQVKNEFNVRACVFQYLKDGKPTTPSKFGWVVIYGKNNILRKCKVPYPCPASARNDAWLYFISLINTLIEKDHAKEADKKYAATLELGTIFSTSFGYDQTNINYYQLVAKKGELTLIFKRIRACSEAINPSSNKLSPLPDTFLNDTEYSCRVRNNHISIQDQYARKVQYREICNGQFKVYETAIETHGR